MKKLFFTIALLASTMIASAQVYVGGGVGFWNNDDAEETSYSFTPEIGYCFSDKLAAGVALGFAYEEAGDASLDVLSFNPYVRYTFLRAGNFSVFADGAFDLAKIEPDEGDSETAWGIGIKPGISYSINEKFSILAHVGFLGYRDADETISTIYKPGFGLNLSNSLSFSLYNSF